jgi:hypothetical protein
MSIHKMDSSSQSLGHPCPESKPPINRVPDEVLAKILTHLLKIEIVSEATHNTLYEEDILAEVNHLGGLAWLEVAGGLIERTKWSIKSIRRKQGHWICPRYMFGALDAKYLGTSRR